MRLLPLAVCCTLLTTGAAFAEAEQPGDLAVVLASQWGLADSALLVVDAQSKKPLLCVSAVHETGDSLVSEKAADLICRGKIAHWLGGDRWVRVSGLTHRWSGDNANQLIVLFAFAEPSGPSDEDVSRLLKLAIAKPIGGISEQVEVHRGLSGVKQ